VPLGWYPGIHDAIIKRQEASTPIYLIP